MALFVQSRSAGIVNEPNTLMGPEKNEAVGSELKVKTRAIESQR